MIKSISTKLPIFLSAAVLLGCGALASAADAVITTTTSAGTISEFSPDSIVVRSETVADPIRYSYTKSTTYVDETGAPVAVETVKSCLPVTVYYIKEGDRMIANKVVVRRAVTAPSSPIIEEKKTTTTTSESK